MIYYFYTTHSKKKFQINENEVDSNFTGDMEALLRPEIADNQETAFEWLKNEIIERM